jgi:NAD(P)-dependent dehydrogenase (short-subunit alcohol dehydrogenase family)
MSKAALNALTVSWAKAFPRWRVNSATPGLTATDFSPLTGGRGARVEDAVEVIVQLACIGPDGPTAGFFENDGAGSMRTVPW